MATIERKSASRIAADSSAFPIPHSPFPISLFLVPVCFVLAAFAVLPLDLTAARWSLEESPLRFLAELFVIGEAFGHGIGVGLIGLVIFVLDPIHRRTLVRVLAGAWGAGLWANLGKLFVARMRPLYWLDVGGESVRDTFVAWFPWGKNESVLQSFPSAHTATAVGFALTLSWLYPRGRWLFAFFAALVGLQRIVAHQHFPSDVLCGAAVGWIIGQSCLRGPIATCGFERFERGQ